MTGIISEEKYLYLPSSSSTAANTPAATEDKQFVFPPSGLSRATSKISETSTDDKEKEKDELQSGQQTPVENYLPTLEYVPSQKVVLSKSKRILLGTVMMSTTFVAVSLMKNCQRISADYFHSLPLCLHLFFVSRTLQRIWVSPNCKPSG